MSCVLCSACDRLIDTDYDVECWMPDDSVLCTSCQENREYCDSCEQVKDAHGYCYDEECRKREGRAQISEDRHNDPRRR